MYVNYGNDDDDDKWFSVLGRKKPSQLVNYIYFIIINNFIHKSYSSSPELYHR
jgi:hypothetical protein